ncbi:hypothetical protein STEG23_016559 [Scotinomys teguina]
MMCLVPLFLVYVLFPATQATQLSKCEVYRAVEDMDGYGGITAMECADLRYISQQRFQHTSYSQNNGSTDFLNNDLTDDKMCAKILAIKGIDYWLAHKPLCSEKLEQWRCEKP